MKINHDNAGFTRVTLGVRHGIKRFLFHESLAFFPRFSGFFLLGWIAYLHFFFDSVNPDHRGIETWMLSYLAYLLVLEYLRYRKPPSYDADGLVLFRILSNLFLISWLLYSAPLMRGVLAFTYLIPFIACMVYFPQNQKLLVALYASSIVALGMATAVFDLKSPLTLSQIAAIATILGLALIVLRHIYDKVSGLPEVISTILTRLQNTFGLAELLDQIVEGVSMITGGDKLFLLIVDPEDRSYVTHKIHGMDLSPSFKMEELIRQCAAIQAGKRYETDDLDDS